MSSEYVTDLPLNLLQYTLCCYFVCYDVTRKNCIKYRYFRKSKLSKTKIGKNFVYQLLFFFCNKYCFREGN
jgi:hypothetical protein